MRILRCHLPVPFRIILQNLAGTKPQRTDNNENKLRSVLLEILNRLPQNDVLKPYVQELLETCMQALRTDNEDNAITCLRVIFDLHKNYRPSLEREVQPFLDFVCNIYKGFADTVTYFFGTEELEGKPGAVPQHKAGELVLSTSSFKVVTECPLIVMFLIQLYPPFIKQNIPILLPLMVNVISISGPRNVPTAMAAHFSDLKAAQVKTVSFLTYLLRSFAEFLIPHQESVSASVVNLLVTSPDSVAIRKELLVATRHVLATDFREGFKSKIDMLLDEKVLIGEGRACFDTLRPLAYSLLAEFIHHVRLHLNLSQLSKIVYLFSRNMHDSSLPLSVQTTCVRLMLNLVESIFRRRGDDMDNMQGRALLVRILDSFVSKFGTVGHTVEQLHKARLEKGGQATAGSAGETPIGEADERGAMLYLQNLQGPGAKETSDCKQLLRTLIMGMKTLLWSITNFNRLTQQQARDPSKPDAPRPQKGMSSEELLISTGILKRGLPCLIIFDAHVPAEREILDHFAAVFTVLEPRNFQDMFSLQLESLYSAILKQESLICLPSTLLRFYNNNNNSNNNVGRNFGEVLATFLVREHLEDLHEPSSPRAVLTLKLFHILIQLVAANRETEVILQPHLAHIVRSFVKFTTKSEELRGYLKLLQLLFKALSSDNKHSFELLYREFLTVLSPCLQTFLGLLKGPTGKQYQDILVELILRLPANISSLLPQLPKLMLPLLCAVKAKDRHLQALGLFVLESWIDSLNPEFLEPAMKDIHEELLETLWKMVQPRSLAIGSKALQLLGKLGGGNRLDKHALELESKDNPEHGLRLILTFEPNTSFLVPLDRSISLARQAISRAELDIGHRKCALNFLRICVCSTLALKATPQSTPVSLNAQTLKKLLLSPSTEEKKKPASGGQSEIGSKTKTQVQAETTVLQQLLEAVMIASNSSQLVPADDANASFLSDLCVHFAILFSIIDSRNGDKPPAQLMAEKEADRESLKEIDPSVFFDALVSVLCSDEDGAGKAGLAALQCFVNALVDLEAVTKAQSGDATKASAEAGGSPRMMYALNMLVPKLTHACYGNSFAFQLGGLRSLKMLTPVVAKTGLLRKYSAAMLRALLQVLQLLPRHAPDLIRESSEAVRLLVRTCVPEEAKAAGDAPVDVATKAEVTVASSAEPTAANPSAQETEKLQDNPTLKSIVEVLAVELFNANAATEVQVVVTAELEYLAQRCSLDVAQLLHPLHTQLLQSLVGKPLRLRSVDAQLGTVRVLSYCLALRPPLLRASSDHIGHFLQEALTISEQEESSRFQVISSSATAGTALQLKSACLELLCSAMALQTPLNVTPGPGQQPVDLRSRIIGVFFKSLTSSKEEVVAVAKEGLRSVIRKQNLPKEQLQSSLRPILLNLANYKSLTLPLLQGLARLLELLSNLFNVTLGEKLMEHLKKWLEPEKLAQASQTAWKPGEEPKIAAGILELFHLLPAAASRFLVPLVKLVIDLELALPAQGVYSELCSPYLPPLTRFLNRYPTETVALFLSQLKNPAMFRRFLRILKGPDGAILGKEAMSAPYKLLGVGMGLGESEEAINSYLEDPANTVWAKSEHAHCLKLILVLAKMEPSWLATQPQILKALRILWRSPRRTQRLQQEEKLTLLELKESKRLVKCFLLYLRQNRKETDLLFEILSIFGIRSRVDYSFLKRFYTVELQEYSADDKQIILRHFLGVFTGKSLPQSQLVFGLQLVIIPMLEHLAKQSESSDGIAKMVQGVFDQDSIKIIVEQVLDPPEQALNAYQDDLRAELLQLATLLIRHVPDSLLPYRKELIKFGWNHLKREDYVGKWWAFVNIAHFLQAYQAPEKIILQVFVALLRTCQPESRQLVRQALDVLTPALPVRMAQGEHRYPMWIRYTKKTLVEEGHSLPHLVHVWQLVVRHSSLYFSSRAQFVPQMVNSLSRLGLAPNSPPENRRLALDLANLIIRWDEQRIAGVKDPTQKVPDQNERSALKTTEGTAKDLSRGFTGILEGESLTRMDSLKGSKVGTPSKPAALPRPPIKPLEGIPPPQKSTPKVDSQPDVPSSDGRARDTVTATDDRAPESKTGDSASDSAVATTVKVDVAAGANDDGKTGAEEKASTADEQPMEVEAKEDTKAELVQDQQQSAAAMDIDDTKTSALPQKEVTGANEEGSIEGKAASKADGTESMDTDSVRKTNEDAPGNPEEGAVVGEGDKIAAGEAAKAAEKLATGRALKVDLEGDSLKDAANDVKGSESAKNGEDKMDVDGEEGGTQAKPSEAATQEEKDPPEAAQNIVGSEAAEDGKKCTNDQVKERQEQGLSSDPEERRDAEDRGKKGSPDAKNEMHEKKGDEKLVGADKNDDQGSHKAKGEAAAAVEEGKDGKETPSAGQSDLVKHVDTTAPDATVPDSQEGKAAEADDSGPTDSKLGDAVEKAGVVDVEKDEPAGSTDRAAREAAKDAGLAAAVTSEPQETGATAPGSAQEDARPSSEVKDDATAPVDPKVGDKRGRASDSQATPDPTSAEKRPKTADGADGVAADISKDASRQSMVLSKPGDVGADKASASPSNAQSDADTNWAPTQPMIDMVVNYLVRMAVHSGEAKDRELSALYGHVLSLLERALKVWPGAVVRLSFLDKLLSTQDAGNNPALAPALDVLKCVLAQQPKVLAGHSQQIYKMAEHCFASDNLKNHKSICDLLKIVFGPSEGKDNVTSGTPASQIHMRIGELIAKYLAVPSTPPPAARGQQAVALPPSPPNRSVLCCLQVLHGLLEVGHTAFIDRFLPTLLKLLHRYARERMAHVSNKVPGNSSIASDPVIAKQALHIVCVRVPQCPEHKKLFVQTLVLLIQDCSADPATLLPVVESLRRWLTAEKAPAAGLLTPKEAVLFLQRLATIERADQGPGASRHVDKKEQSRWKDALLELLHDLCTSEQFPQALRTEVFQKVERVFMLGLRADRLSVDRSIFSLYHESIGKSLFMRLQHIITGMDWEALSDSFWLKQALQLLLAILVEAEPITLAPNSAQIAPLVSFASPTDIQALASSKPDPQAIMPMDVDGSPGAQSRFDALVAGEIKFLERLDKQKVIDLVTPLRNLAGVDANIAYHLWVLIFPIVWATLQKDEQVALAKPMISLLSKEYHSKQALARPNVVQALLEGISLSQPQPKIPSELIKYLGKTYNAWYIAIPLLESHVTLFPQEGRCFDALAEMYRLLGEDDMLAGLWRRRCVARETKVGLSLIQHGLWQQAQEVFYGALHRTYQGDLQNGPSKAEICLWEEKWIQCGRQLNQWELLSDFAKGVEHYDLLVDSLWRISEWTTLKETILPKAQVEETPRLKMVQAYVALTDGNITEGSQHISRGVARAIEQWWALPEVGVCPRVPLLQSFHQLVELQESTRVFIELSKAQRQPQHSFKELKDILETWRLRLPNKWDSVSHWNDVIMWRNHVYSTVINTFKTFHDHNPALHQLGFKDKAWSVNKLAGVVRKQGLGEVAVQILNKMYGYLRMEVQEAFIKIREQAKAYLSMPGEMPTGLNLLNTTNLEYFLPGHKAEIFRLKAEFLQRLGDGEQAHHLYLTALQLNRNLVKGWPSWGTFCDSRYTESNDPLFLEYAVSCYLQGIKYGNASGRSKLARVWSLLSFDNVNGLVGKAIDKHADGVPLWVWLMWIPQLLVSLQRPEAVHVKAILMRIARVYPQALYYSLRTFLLERRDAGAQRAAGKDGKDTPGYDASLTPAGAFDAAKEVMEVLRRDHPNLAAELELLLTEVGSSRFSPRPEERLLAVVYALLTRAYKYPMPASSEVPVFLQRELAGVCKACFSPETVNKHGEFVHAYKEEFESDLDPEKRTFPKTLTELTARLKKWRNKLQGRVQARLPGKLLLEEESKQLRHFRSREVEIPGQYLNDAEVSPEHTIKLERIGSDVGIVRRHGTSHRTLSFIGNNGRVTQFLVQTSLTPGARSDERVLQIFRVWNKLLSKHRESRRRQLLFHVPVMVPVWPQVRLVEDEPSYTSLGEVYEINCARYGRAADAPVAYFKERLSQAGPQLQQDPNAALQIRHQTYKEVASQLVTENILSQYMYKTLPTGNHLWVFKRQFAAQMALSGLASHLLHIGARAPTKTLFAKSSGKVFQLDFHCLYDGGKLEAEEPVPFRLTRNLQSFITPFGVEGIFVTSMVAASQVSPSSHYLVRLWCHIFHVR
eukprot:scaffold6247_cov416-Prasinococcus_capsulatus_cf.AAC.17